MHGQDFGGGGGVDYLGFGSTGLLIFIHQYQIEKCFLNQELVLRAELIL